MWGPGIPSRMQVAAHPYFHCNFWRCLPCSPGGGRVLMTVLDSLRPLGSPLSLSCRPCPASWIRLNADAKIKAPSATYLPAVRPVRASVPAPVERENSAPTGTISVQTHGLDTASAHSGTARFPEGALQPRAGPCMHSRPRTNTRACTSAHTRVGLPFTQGVSAHGPLPAAPDLLMC